MKKICLPIFVVLVFFLSTAAQAQVKKLSDSARISLITCGPWQGELYSAFGHSAFRVYDPEQDLDWVFNYGTFDFNQPNFYLNFARGKNQYMLSVQEYSRPGTFKDFYISYNRYIHEQILNLNHYQKQRLYTYLMNNAKPEYRGYYYDYFYDNCSTRPRDVLKKVFGNHIHFESEHISGSKTIRQLTEDYLKHQPWGDLGIDICLGLPMDKVASPIEYTFLPDYLEQAFDHAHFGSGRQSIPLVKEKKIVYAAANETHEFSLFHPWFVFGTLFLIVTLISFFDFRNKKITRWIDYLLFSITGVLGVLLVLLWFGTDHKAAAQNFNLLWAMPLNLYFPFVKDELVRKKYFQVMSLLTLLLLLVWAILPQELNVFLVPVVASILIRYLINSDLVRKLIPGRG
jgi:hypothetical protein